MTGCPDLSAQNYDYHADATWNVGADMLLCTYDVAACNPNIDQPSLVPTSSTPVAISFLNNGLSQQTCSWHVHCESCCVNLEIQSFDIESNSDFLHVSRAFPCDLL